MAYQRPQLVRALYEAAVALPQKTGEPWSDDEDRKLLARARLLKYGRINA